MVRTRSAAAHVESLRMIVQPLRTSGRAWREDWPNSLAEVKRPLSRSRLVDQPGAKIGELVVGELSARPESLKLVELVGNAETDAAAKLVAYLLGTRFHPPTLGDQVD